jgi:hypothetical protein
VSYHVGIKDINTLLLKTCHKKQENRRGYKIMNLK